MRRIGSGWVVVAGLAFVVGCPEAIYTLGRLPGEGPQDASTSDGAAGNRDASAGTGGDGGAGMSGMGGVGGSAGSGGTGGVECVAKRVKGVRKGLNLYLMVDSSFAIALQPVYAQVTQAISAFVDDPDHAGIGVGIRFYGVSCNASDYARPSVEVAPLPDAASRIRASYPLPLNGVAAAIAPVIEGAADYAAMLQTQDPTRATDVVLLSDGLFDASCGSGINEAIAAAGAAFTGAPSVRTHVVGIDSGLLDPLNMVDLAPLDSLAAAGGSQAARRVQVGASSATQIQEALDATAAAAQPCGYEIPAGFAANRIAIEWRVTGNPAHPAEVWPRVARAAACSGRRALYRDPDGMHITLCPAACDALLLNPKGLADLREDCL